MRRPAYCTQPRSKCASCSLTNYGLDCANNPLPKKVPQTRYTRTMAAYTGFPGSRTVEAVLAQIPDDLQRRLTGRELGMVMTAINDAYHNGRASHGGLDLCGDAVWLPWGGKITDGKESGQLIPISVLRQIKVTRTSRAVPRDPVQVKSLGGPESFTEITITYKLDATETT